MIKQKNSPPVYNVLQCKLAKWPIIDLTLDRNLRVIQLLCKINSNNEKENNLKDSLDINNKVYI